MSGAPLGNSSSLRVLIAVDGRPFGAHLNVGEGQVGIFDRDGLLTTAGWNGRRMWGYAPIGHDVAWRLANALKRARHEERRHELRMARLKELACRAS